MAHYYEINDDILENYNRKKCLYGYINKEK
jgi:hypothetical protein